MTFYLQRNIKNILVLQSKKDVWILKGNVSDGEKARNYLRLINGTLLLNIGCLFSSWNRFYGIIFSTGACLCLNRENTSFFQMESTCLCTPQVNSFSAYVKADRQQHWQIPECCLLLVYSDLNRVHCNNHLFQYLCKCTFCKITKNKFQSSRNKITKIMLSEMQFARWW